MNKKLLIIKPPYRTFPVGFAYVLACLESNDIPFDFIDTAIQSSDYRKILRKNDYLAVASGGLLGHYDFFSDIVHQVRTISPNLPIILGGNITKDINSDYLFDKIGIDYGILGEAETSLPYLIDTLVKGSNDFENVPGLVYKDKFSGKVIKNPPRRLNLQDVNILPAWHHIDIDFYSKDCYLPFWGIRSAMPVLSGRGCVGVCSFCSPTIGSFQMRPIKHVIEEIEFLNSTYDFDWIIFFNEMFYPSKEKILDFCRAYSDVKLRKPWVCILRTDANLDRETFIAMKEAGCVSTGAGIESGSDKVLQLMRKRTTVEQIKKFYRDAREVGLPCCGTFMVGNEGETEEDLKQTIDMVIHEEMNCDASLTRTYPGTLIYKNALKRGLIKNEWEYFKQLWDWADVFVLNWKNGKYLNITEIPNERFWDVMVKELRRYYTFNFYRFQAKDIKYETIFGMGMERITMSGLCPECGHRVDVYFVNRLLGTEAYCPNCFYRVFFNLYKLKDFTSHFELLCRELKKAERLVILGTNSDASTILRIDYFGLNYDRIIGFLEIKQQQLSGSPFIKIPIFQIRDLYKIQPDTILVVDDTIGDAELLLKLFYSREGLQFPRILQLIPDKKRWSLRLTRLVGRFVPEKGTNIIHRTILVLGIQLLRAGFSLKTAVKRAAKQSLQLLYLTIGIPNTRNLVKRIKHLYGKVFL